MSEKLIGKLLKDYFELIKNVIENQNNLGLDLQSAKDDSEVSQKLDKYFLETTEVVNVHRAKLAEHVTALASLKQEPEKGSNLIIS